MNVLDLNFQEDTILQQEDTLKKMSNQLSIAANDLAKNKAEMNDFKTTCEIQIEE